MTHCLEIFAADKTGRMDWRPQGTYRSVGEAAEAARHVGNRARVVTIHADGRREAREVERPIPPATTMRRP